MATEAAASAAESVRKVRRVMCLRERFIRRDAGNRELEKNLEGGKAGILE
jgi:hypothetical protein